MSWPEVGFIPKVMQGQRLLLFGNLTIVWGFGALCFQLGQEGNAHPFFKTLLIRSQQSSCL